MAEIKDKIVTLESLSALHEYNEKSYVKNNEKSYMTKSNPAGSGSLSMNRMTGTTVGNYSTTVGYNNKASAYASYAEGEETIASAYGSHAEGIRTTANGGGSHAEGNKTQTTATAAYSHAEGSYTIASSSFQHVQGKYNIEDTEGKYAHIVGNGTYNSDTSTAIRSNAHTLDWNGNAWFAGDGVFDGTIYADGSATVGSIDNLSLCIANNAYIGGGLAVEGNSMFNGEIALLGNNELKLSEGQYGDTLPTAGNAGRIFFKKLSE